MDPVQSAVSTNSAKLDKAYTGQNDKVALNNPITFVRSGEAFS